MLLPEKIGELAAYLAQGGQLEQGVALFNALCSRLLGTETEHDQWRHEQPLKKHLPELVRSSGVAVLDALCQQLTSLLEARDERGDLILSDFSPVWRPAIEDHEQNRYHGHFSRYPVANILITLIRDATEQLVRDQQSSLQEVLEHLERQRHVLFRRLALHLLRLFPAQAHEQITRYLMDHQSFDHPDLHHEYALLLQQQFVSLPPESQAIIFGWIEQGPNLDEFRADYERRNGKQPSDTSVSTYAQQWRLEKLAILGSSSLPREWKQRYEQLITDYGPVEHPEFPIYIGEVSTLVTESSFRSPKTAEELGQMPLEELVSLLREWQPPPAEPFRFPSASREALGQMLSLAVEANPSRFAEEASAFIGLQPVYVSSVLTGLERAARQKKQYSWPPVLDLCGWVVYQATITTQSTEKQAQYEPQWSWCRLTTALLLTAGCEREEGEIPFELRARVWDILESLTHDPQPTPEEENPSGGPARRPADLAINTVRGLAMHAVVGYTFWVRRHLLKTRGKQRIKYWFNQMPEVQTVLNTHLDLEADPSMAIRSVYGTKLTWLAWLDRPWVAHQLAKIFPTALQHQQIWRAAWEAYVVFCHPYGPLFNLLQAEYRRAIEEAATTQSTMQHPYNPDERLAEHLMILYWHGKLSLDEDKGLLIQYFARAPEPLRGHGLEFVGRNLYQEQGPILQETLARLQSLWEWRMGEAVPASAPPTPSEIAAFGWWFSSGKFEVDWAVTQLKKALIALKGLKNIDARHLVLERLVQISQEQPLAAVECLALLTGEEQEDWRVFAEKQHMQAILLQALQGDTRTHKQARDLINRLALRGDLEFFELLQERPPQRIPGDEESTTKSSDILDEC